MGDNPAQSGRPDGPSGAMKTAIVVALLAAIAAVLHARRPDESETVPTLSDPATPEALAATAGQLPAAIGVGLPRLVELGSDKCVPCKLMAPILDELREQYAGRLDVAFIDVWLDPDAAKRHNVVTIPTQLFLDASGRELSRHEGFMSKDDILGKWAELGVNLHEAESQ